MAFLGRAKKCDLVELCKELGETIIENVTVCELINLIKKSENYEVNLVKEILEAIKENRIEKEERKCQEEEEEKLRQERQKQERQFELEKLRLSAQLSGPSNQNIGTTLRNKLDIHKLMQNFDPKEDEISLYLVIFERQAKRAEIPKEEWVTHLLSFLSPDITKLIARESEEQTYNYDHVKEILMKKFKLSPEKFRIKFIQHQMKYDNSWKDFVFELRNYLNEWVQGLEVKNFETLLDLMVTDQTKRRVPNEVRDHFIDTWSKITSSTKLAEIFDEYENVRGSRKRIDLQVNSENRRSNWREENATLKNSQGATSKNANYDQFDRRTPLKCYECGSTNHLRPQCPKLKCQKPPAQVNRIGVGHEEDKLLTPYTLMAKVNGVRMPVLRDSGATIDIICRKYVTPDMFTGETVWVQQPLDEGPTYLPLAKVSISGQLGDIVSKAAVVRSELDKGRYLLGNRTAARLSNLQMTPMQISELNAVNTRSQTRLKAENEEYEQQNSNDSENSSEQNNKNQEIILEEKDDEPVLETDAVCSEIEEILPTLNANSDELSLIQVDHDDFVKAQQDSAELKSVFKSVEEGIQNQNNKHRYVVEKKLLFKC
nr:uncharacterized protein LOC122270040 [Parasteatoda tepidariorum]